MGFLYANKGGNAIPPDYNSIKTENVELKKTNKDLRDQTTSLNKRISDLESQLNQANTTISELNEEIKSKNTQPDLSQRVKDLENELAKANSTIKTLRNEKDKLQRGLNAANEEIKRLGKKKAITNAVIYRGSSD